MQGGQPANEHFQGGQTANEDPQGGRASEPGSPSGSPEPMRGAMNGWPEEWRMPQFDSLRLIRQVAEGSMSAVWEGDWGGAHVAVTILTRTRARAPNPSLNPSPSPNPNPNPNPNPHPNPNPNPDPNPDLEREHAFDRLAAAPKGDLSLGRPLAAPAAAGRHQRAPRPSCACGRLRW